MQDSYWNKVAWDKTFTHPLDQDLLSKYQDKNDLILDYGCGYGRTLKELKKAGYSNIKGYDTSVELIKRAKKEGAEEAEYIHSVEELPLADQSVSCIILFAVLTCIPENKEQLKIVEALAKKLKSGGIIYLSDYYLQEKSTELKSYSFLESDKENFGVFTLPEGVMIRHHTKEWIIQLLSAFEIMDHKEIDVRTMNGNNAKAFQMIAQKR